MQSWPISPMTACSRCRAGSPRRPLPGFAGRPLRRCQPLRRRRHRHFQMDAHRHHARGPPRRGARLRLLHLSRRPRGAQRFLLEDRGLRRRQAADWIRLSRFHSAGARSGDAEYLPAAVIARLAAGQHPVRGWRDGRDGYGNYTGRRLARVLLGRWQGRSGCDRGHRERRAVQAWLTGCVAAVQMSHQEDAPWHA